MDDVAKYEIELKSKDDKYTTVRIGGLKKAYFKDGDGNLLGFGGICGLIKNKDHEGYCIHNLVVMAVVTIPTPINMGTDVIMVILD